MQTVLTSLIACDEDSSGFYSDRDIQLLELRLRHLPGIKVNQSLLLEKVRASDCSLQTILQYVQHCGQDNLDPTKRVFMFDEEKFRP